MKYTENMSLKVPEGTDYFDIDDFNYNNTIIDDIILTNKQIIDEYKIKIEDVRKVYTACLRKGVAPKDLSLNSILVAINSIDQNPMPLMLTGNAYFKKEGPDHYYIHNLSEYSDTYFEDRLFSYLLSPISKKKAEATNNEELIGFKYYGITCCISICFKYDSSKQVTPKSYILGNYPSVNIKQDEWSEYENLCENNKYEGLVYNGYAINITPLHPCIYIDNQTSTLHVSMSNDPFFSMTAPFYNIESGKAYTITLRMDRNTGSFYTFLFDEDINLLYSKASLISNWYALPYEFGYNRIFPFLFFHHHVGYVDSQDNYIYYDHGSDILIGQDYNHTGYYYDRANFSLSIDLLNSFISVDSYLEWGNDTNNILYELDKITYPSPDMSFNSIPQFVCMANNIHTNNEHNELFVEFQTKEKGNPLYFSNAFMCVPYFRGQLPEQKFSYYGNEITFYIRFKYLDAVISSVNKSYLLGTYSDQSSMFNDHAYGHLRKYLPNIIVNSTNDILCSTENSDISFSLTKNTIYTLIYKYVYTNYQYDIIYLYLLDYQGNLIESNAVLHYRQYDGYNTCYSPPLPNEEVSDFPVFGGSFSNGDMDYNYGYATANGQSGCVQIDLMNTFWSEDGNIRWGLDIMGLNGCEEDWPKPTPPTPPTPPTTDLQLGNNTVSIVGSEWTDYYFTPTTADTYHIYSTGSYDPKIEIYDNNDNLIDSDDDSGTDNNFDLSTTLTANIRYRFSIYSYSGDVTINVTIGSSTPPGPGPGPTPPDPSTGYYQEVQAYDSPGFYTFTATESKWYQLQVWGAQGGYDPQSGATNPVTGEYFSSEISDNTNCGGYAVGEIYLESGTTLYIGVGECPSNSLTGGTNGGGNGTYDEYTYDGELDYDTTAGYYTHHNVYAIGAGGGGATHMALSSGSLSELENDLDNILIVAGGGGGDSFYCHTAYDAVESGYYVYQQYCNGGSGGGFIGGLGYNTGTVIPIPDSSGSNLADKLYDNYGNYITGFGGSQTWGGENYANLDNPSGSFGYGGFGDTGYYCYAGGGGGLYGGSASHAGNASGGGSGWIRNSQLTNKHMAINYYGHDQADGFSDLKMDAFTGEYDPDEECGYYYGYHNGQFDFDLDYGTTINNKMSTIAGFQASSGYTVNYGQLGNGYARISEWEYW